MTSLSPRGPLPARVYWRRRLIVLGLAIVLVVGLARLLTGGSDGSSDEGGAAVLAGAPTSSSGSASPTARATDGRTPSAAAPTTPASPPTSTPPASPSGPCADRDVAVTPSVPTAVAGPRGGVTIDLDLRTITAEACTWRVSPRTLTLKVTSGRDDIWSTQDCPRAVPSQDVVVRKAESARVTLAWTARRSDEDCSRQTDYAMPGYYHVAAAALTGEPAKVQFQLVAPTAPTVTRTAKPKQDPKAGRGTKPGRQPSAPVDEPLGQSPSGAVEP
ncbi:hypothetical protein [Nocardioides pantholopis]|uniref:hypothetical protein n=1 Tax=Nocardioides pantholopis TaxID=2483798 RepID=UPI000FDBFF37|nr:hypothetical protein [Nocardioides pantholopis]